MPQMNKGGKFIFGKSVIRADGTVRIPPQAVQEYQIAAEGRVYLFTGSRSTGGFCVTRRGLLEPSQLGHILSENPALLHGTLPHGAFLPYKGRAYCWTDCSEDGTLCLSRSMMECLALSPGDTLLAIRSSDIAFTMGVKGPLLERARRYEGEIPVF